MKTASFWLSKDGRAQFYLSRVRRIGKSVPILAAGFTVVLLALGLVACPVNAQNYLTQVGAPTFTTALPVESGFLDASNGNLHLSIPLGSLPERGSTRFAAALVYDSRIWQPVNNGTATSWQPTNVPSSPWGGWRFVSTGLTGKVAYSQSSGECIQNGIRVPGHITYFNFMWTSPDGTQHSFPITTTLVLTSGCGVNRASGNAFATDSSGYHMYVTNLTTATVYAPDGTEVSPTVKDTNGNYYSTDSNGNIIDTLGRTPVTVKTNCNGNSSETCYDVLNSQGGTEEYTVTTESVSVDTSFGQPGVTEYSGTVTAIQSVKLPNGTSYTFTYDSGTTAGHYGELTGITLPTGGQISYGYTSFLDSYGNINRWVSSRTSGGNLWQYTPAVVSTCSSGQTGCQEKVTVLKPSGDNIVYFFALNNGSWRSSAVFYTGAVSGSNSVKTVSSSWDFNNPCTLQNCTGSGNIQKLSETTYVLTPGGTLLTRTTEYTFDSINDGNVTQISEWNYYTTQGASPDRITNISYLTGYPNNIIDRPKTITVTNGAGTTTYSQTNITYDSYGSGLVSKTGVANHDDTNFGTTNTQRGNPTQIQKLVSGSTYLTTSTMTYDTTGQVLSVQDAAGNTTSMSYADNFYNDNNASPPSSYAPSTPTNAYLTQLTLPLIGAETFGYYYGTGQRALSTDQNGATAYNHYVDDFDRPTETVFPVGWSLFSYPSNTEIDSYLGITTTSPSTGCTSCRHNETVLDNLGRVTDSNLVNDPDGETTVATTYDSNGRVLSVTNPSRTTSNGSDTYAYDGLDRALSVTHTDNNSVTASFGAKVGGTGVNTTQLCSSSTYGFGYPVLTVDEAGKKREMWMDGFGRTIEVDEPNSSGSLSENTCYAYDLNNNLTQAVSATGQTRTYQYDDLSRVTSVATPETKLSGTQYSTTFSYTSGGSSCSGNPFAACQRTDGRGITTTYTYDALNRLAKITYSDSTPTVTYCYDGSNSTCISGGFSSANGKGRRTAIADGSGNCGWSYDSMGHIVTEKRTIAGITKTMSYSYNEDGSVASVTYPSGHVVTYTTSNAERPLSATDSGSAINYALTASYAPMGALSAVIYGQATGFNGTTESRAYNNRMEMTSDQASSSNGTAMNLSPCFNPFSFSSGCSSTDTNNNGSVTGITNSVDSNESQTFSYDTLNRISSAATKSTSGNDCWGQNFGPDAAANLTSISVSQCTAGSLSVSTDGNNHLSATGYGYDNAGNMTSDGMYTYAYDAENRITSANGVTYTYDGDGLRVKKSSGTLYWRSIWGDVLAESDLSGNITNEYVFFAGRRIAQRTSGGSVYFYYADALGTVHTITDATGHACYDASFTPYGQEVLNPNITQTCSSNYKFTGYEYDSETGLYYAKARYYNPRLGRFMSTDPLGGDVGDPQSLNRYAYVGNHPTDSIDPSGMVNVPGYHGWWGGGGLGYLLQISLAIQSSLGGFGSGWNEFDSTYTLYLNGGTPVIVNGLDDPVITDPSNPGLTFDNGIIYITDENGVDEAVGMYTYSGSVVALFPEMSAAWQAMKAAAEKGINQITNPNLTLKQGPTSKELMQKVLDETADSPVAKGLRALADIFGRFGGGVVDFMIMAPYPPCKFQGQVGCMPQPSRTF